MKTIISNAATIREAAIEGERIAEVELHEDISFCWNGLTVVVRASGCGRGALSKLVDEQRRQEYRTAHWHSGS